MRNGDVLIFFMASASRAGLIFCKQPLRDNCKRKAHWPGKNIHTANECANSHGKRALSHTNDCSMSDYGVRFVHALSCVCIFVECLDR